MVEEVEVPGYDLVSLVPNGEELSDGFSLTNRIWKHIEMPETGESGIWWVWLAAGGIIVVGAAGTVSFLYRRRTDIRA